MAQHRHPARRGRVVLALLALSPAWLCGLAACGANHKPPVGGAGGQGGARYGGPCWGNTVCDESDAHVVRSCESATFGAPVATCQGDDVCSLGRCTSRACAELLTATSIAGCLFYTTALDNVDSDDLQPTLIVVANVSDTVTRVRLEGRSADQPWVTVQSATIEPGSARTFSVVGAPLQGDGYAAALARRVVSDAPVTVMVVQSDDDDHGATSSSGTMLLPDHAIGVRYMAMTYQQTPTPRMAEMAGARDGAGEIAIVATADATRLEIWPPGAPMDSAPTIKLLSRDGDVYQMLSESDGDDLTGTLIQSDKPISVFSGNVVTAYGQTGPGINSPDMAMEQMLPVSEWSKTYVAARLPPQTSACDSLFPPSVSGGPVGNWRVVAEHQATLFFTSPPTIQGLPSLPTTIARALPSPLPVTGTGDFIVHSDVPILVTQGMDCEATLSSAVPVDGPLGPQLLALAPNFEHLLAIVRKDDRFGTPVMFDGEDIGGTFVPIGDGFSVARRTIPACYGSIDQCVHRLVGAYGLTMRGMDVACSYALTVPTWPACNTDSCR